MILKFRDITSEQLDKLTQLIDSKFRNGKFLLAAYSGQFKSQDIPGTLRIMPCTASGQWLGDRDMDHSLAQIISTKVENTLEGTFFEVTVTLVERFMFTNGSGGPKHRQTEVIRTPSSILKEIMEALDLFPSD